MMMDIHGMSDLPRCGMFLDTSQIPGHIKERDTKKEQRTTSKLQHMQIPVVLHGSRKGSPAEAAPRGPTEGGQPGRG
jgi:hypothetical protein